MRVLWLGLIAATTGCATSIVDTSYVGDAKVSGKDSSTLDSGEELDTNEPSTDSGTTPKDSGTTVPDTFVDDTSVADTFVPDTFVPDTYVPDTFVPDTYVADTAPPDTGAPTPVEVIFPKTGDSKAIAKDPYIWTNGDWIQGVRTTTLAAATSVSGTWQITNSLSSCGKVYVDVSINGTKVGALNFGSGTSSVPVSFSFAAIAGPTYTIRYQLTATVGSGCGAFQTVWDTSKLTLK